PQEAVSYGVWPAVWSASHQRNPRQRIESATGIVKTFLAGHLIGEVLDVHRSTPSPRRLINTTTERGPARYVCPVTTGAEGQSWISFGESRDVSIHRRHGWPAANGNSNSRGSQ